MEKKYINYYVRLKQGNFEIRERKPARVHIKEEVIYPKNHHDSQDSYHTFSFVDKEGNIREETKQYIFRCGYDRGPKRMRIITELYEKNISLRDF